jgi:hypothetical protein
MSYYAKFLIEIVIVVDRIMMLVPSAAARLGLKNLLKIKKPYNVLIGVCIFTFLINYPFIYLLYVPSNSVFVNYGYPGYHLYKYFAASRAAWSNQGMAGYYPMLFIYIFKNIITFIFETFLSLTSLVLFQRHLAHKAKLVGPSAGFNLTVIEGTMDGGGSLATATNRTTARSKNEPSAGGRNMANLVLVKSTTGFVHNMFLTTYTMYYLNYPKVSVTLRILQFCSYFASTLRHSVNFLQFYFFNTTFRREARVFFGRVQIKTTNRVQPSNQNNNNTQI